MENEIISFELAKINRGKEKICKCEVSHYEIDVVNRLVMCTDCGAIVDPFDALFSIAENLEEVEILQKRMLEKARAYTEMANEEMRKMVKNRTFRNMDEQYKKGMVPICPKCNTAFDPIEIKTWVNESLV